MKVKEWYRKEFRWVETGRKKHLSCPFWDKVFFVFILIIFYPITLTLIIMEFGNYIFRNVFKIKIHHD